MKQQWRILLVTMAAALSLLGVTVWAGCIAMAYVYTRCYDEPVRRWLTRRLLVPRNNEP